MNNINSLNFKSVVQLVAIHNLIDNFSFCLFLHDIDSELTFL